MPLEVSDLGHVLAVTCPTQETGLPFQDRRRVLKADPAQTQTGSAECWYREGVKTLKVWPADTSSTFKVLYWKVPAELKESADEPLVPAAYHDDLIVSGTVIRLFKNRKNYEAAQFERQEWERAAQRLLHALGKPNYDRSRVIARTGTAADYLQ